MFSGCARALVELMGQVDRLTEAEVGLLSSVLDFVDYNCDVRIERIGGMPLINERFVADAFINGIRKLIHHVNAEYGIPLGLRTYVYHGVEVINLMRGDVVVRSFNNAVTSGLVPGYYITMENMDGRLGGIIGGRYGEYVRVARLLLDGCGIDGRTLRLPDDYERYICGLRASRGEGVLVFWRKVIDNHEVELVRIHPLMRIIIGEVRRK